MPVPAYTFLMLSGVLFTMGAIGFMVRRNPLVVFMCIELMLNAVNLAFAAMSRYLNSLDGVVFAFLVITVAAAEVVVGIALYTKFLFPVEVTSLLLLIAAVGAVYLAMRRIR